MDAGSSSVIGEMEEPGELKRAFVHATAGAISGAISRTVTSPLDVIKIRFQVIDRIKRLPLGQNLFPYTTTHFEEPGAGLGPLSRLPSNNHCSHMVLNLALTGFRQTIPSQHQPVLTAHVGTRTHNLAMISLLRIKRFHYTKSYY